MSTTRRVRAAMGRKGQEGFALILALLTLVLLTFLGLTLATSTSTELQIATNYRWSQQALYNAEAGLEVGKALLRNMNWTTILPAARQGYTADSCKPDDTSVACWFLSSTHTKPVAPYSRPDLQTGAATRNFENSGCDDRGNGAGYGVVLDDGGGFGPYQNVTSIMSQTVNGSFTLWVRRDLKLNKDGGFSDLPGTNDTTLVLTAEGTAPYTGAAAAATSGMTFVNRSVRTMEATLSRELDTPCGTRGGQVGGGPEGSNFSPCDPITGDSVGAALGGGTRTENKTAQ
jgi:hypothetical protein